MSMRHVLSFSGTKRSMRVRAALSCRDGFEMASIRSARIVSCGRGRSVMPLFDGSQDLPVAVALELFNSCGEDDSAESGDSRRPVPDDEIESVIELRYVLRGQMNVGGESHEDGAFQILQSGDTLLTTLGDSETFTHRATLPPDEVSSDDLAAVSLTVLMPSNLIWRSSVRLTPREKEAALQRDKDCVKRAAWNLWNRHGSKKPVRAIGGGGDDDERPLSIDLGNLESMLVGVAKEKVRSSEKGRERSWEGGNRAEDGTADLVSKNVRNSDVFQLTETNKFAILVPPQCGLIAGLEIFEFGHLTPRWVDDARGAPDHVMAELA